MVDVPSHGAGPPGAAPPGGEMTGREAADHVEIAQVLQRYFQALDEKDYDLLGSVFAAEARLEYALGTTVSESLPGMVARFRAFNERFRATQHLMGHPHIELAGDGARCVTGVRAFHLQETLEAELHPWIVWGFYRDRLERGQLGWRIHERSFRALHSQGDLLPPDRVKRFSRPPWL
jgi:hypothetical protein